jgi:hypothetical protein
MKYQDFVIEVSDTRQEERGGKWLRSLDVRVARSSQLGDAPIRKITTSCDEGALHELIELLDSRDLDRAGLFELGRLLALLLLPAGDGVSGVRELLARNLDTLGKDEGLRLRLLLPALIAAWPWEYLYLDRTGGGEDSMNGFISLDPRVAIVRHEGMPLAASIQAVAGNISVLAAMASPPGMDKLDLDGEEKLLREAFANRPGLELAVIRDATLDDLMEHLDAAQVFHFAGHGAFRQMPGAVVGKLTGRGMLAFQDEMVDAEQLGVNLHRRNIQLAVLGGCETGRRVGEYTAGSIAAGLARAQIPAVVANQFAIHDSSAREFARAFYAALDGGLPLERAMHAGRLAIFNADPDDRDWGVPVLYLRAPHGELFAGATDTTQRETARASAEQQVSVRAAQVGRSGVVTGALLNKVLGKSLKVEVIIDGAVYGTVVGYHEGRDGESHGADVQVKVGDVGEGGNVTGAVFGDEPEPEMVRPPPKMSPRPASPPKHASRPPAPAPAMEEPAPAMSASPPPMPQPSPSGAGAGGSSSVSVGTVNGGTVIGTQYNSTQFTYVQPAPRDPDADLIKEDLRLDVRAPQRVVIEEPFDLQVQIKLPQSPPIAAAASTQVASADGSVFRREESEVINYRIVPSGDGFRFDPASIKLKLYPKTESPVVTFEGVASKTGQRKLRLNAYQDDDTLAAQTALTLEIVIATTPQ